LATAEKWTGNDLFTALTMSAGDRNGRHLTHGKPVPVMPKRSTLEQVKKETELEPTQPMSPGK